MDIDEIRRKNILILEREAGSTKAMHEAVGMSYAQYINLRDGAKDARSGKPRGMRKETAWRFEDAGKKPQGWLDQDHSSNTEPGPDIVGTVPLISLVAAGDWSEAIDSLPPGEGERIEVSVPVRANTFALRVTGDSMEPDFPSGMIIVVEPELDPRPGDYVIAKNGDDATFKQLVKDGPDLYLKRLSMLHDTQSVCRFCTLLSPPNTFGIT